MNAHLQIIHESSNHWVPSFLSLISDIISYIDQYGTKTVTELATQTSLQELDRDFELPIEVGQDCGWLCVTDANVVRLTDMGIQLLEFDEPKKLLRHQIARLIELKPKSLGQLVVRGPVNLIENVSSNQLQCFEEAGLLDSYENDVIEWWDEIANKYRDISTRKISTGRKGERLSIEYETKRTGFEPKWIGFEDPDAGYDLESRIDTNDQNKLFIEVKTSLYEWERAFFYMTRNEWETLTRMPHSNVHLWSISDDVDKHAVISLNELENHVPANTGSGKWEKFKCPFSVFKLGTS